MSAGWVAAQVRSRSLAGHCAGPALARSVASAGSLDGALAILASSNYAERLRPGLDLASSEYALFATVLWDLRVLAGWSPALGASRLHVLAGAFELANLQGELAAIEGHPSSGPFELGSLASVVRHAPCSTVAQLRELLRHSTWGDPGDVNTSGVSIALQFSLARRIVDGVPEATRWATSYAALVLGRVVVEGVVLADDSPAAANVRAVLGSRALAARSIEELRRALARDVAQVLAQVTDSKDLWLGEARWWSRLWNEARDKLQHAGAGPEAVVAAVALQAADAWRVRMALEVAARCGRGIEVLDAVA